MMQHGKDTQKMNREEDLQTSIHSFSPQLLCNGLCKQGPQTAGYTVHMQWLAKVLIYLNIKTTVVAE